MWNKPYHWYLIQPIGYEQEFEYLLPVGLGQNHILLLILDFQTFINNSLQKSRIIIEILKLKIGWKSSPGKVWTMFPLLPLTWTFSICLFSLIPYKLLGTRLKMWLLSWNVRAICLILKSTFKFHGWTYTWTLTWVLIASWRLRPDVRVTVGLFVKCLDSGSDSRNFVKKWKRVQTRVLCRIIWDGILMIKLFWIIIWRDIVPNS